MKKSSVIFLAAIVLLLVGTSAHAFTVDLDGNNATGIRNLEISGTFYDVTFEFAQAGTAPVACGSAVPCDVFFGGNGGTAAQAAVTAINMALNPSAAVTVGSTAAIQYFVPYAKTGVDVTAWQGFFNDPNWVATSGADPGLEISIELARFSPAVVPIPAAVWLFGSALGILGWIRRRTASASF